MSEMVPLSELVELGVELDEARQRAFEGWAGRMRAQAQVERLETALRAIENCVGEGTEAEGPEGQARNDRAWVIRRAREALSSTFEHPDLGSVEDTERT